MTDLYILDAKETALRERLTDDPYFRLEAGRIQYFFRQNGFVVDPEGGVTAFKDGTVHAYLDKDPSEIWPTFTNEAVPPRTEREQAVARLRGLGDAMERGEATQSETNEAVAITVKILLSQFDR